MTPMAILIQYANGIPGVKFPLDSAEITIGRSLDNDISIDDEFVSKRHAVIQLIQDTRTGKLDCILIDNDSTNHLYVNNHRISAHRLKEKDRIFIGQHEFRFSQETIEPVELGQKQSVFFDDDAPGLMHASVQKAMEPTARLKPNKSNQANFDDVSLEGYEVEELTDTKHQLNIFVEPAELSDKDSASKTEADKNKRFSRRLTSL